MARTLHWKLFELHVTANKMQGKSISLKAAITTICCLCSNWLSAQVVKPYQDPDDIRLSDMESINRAVKQSFSKKELCLMKNGYMIFSCKLSDKGSIINITVDKMVGVNVSNSKIQCFKSTIVSNILFHIPSGLRTKETTRFRKASIVIPFKGYCK